MHNRKRELGAIYPSLTLRVLIKSQPRRETQTENSPQQGRKDRDVRDIGIG